ncbi:nuclear intron maturase 2, mitochondrial-like [Selaginella moellendorffii]|uniref:nuclear intron maturase 2, mitochondrial-like n=1 Tax=Selaginella moellendorffii TaxID=88036 RepID=UPI000D1C77B2|nr:nuclear intron maturase 2, mitochondrial-like [Selaginella moellendorffii]|eukprot:XP_024543818.1 nuclear intron maturase 2, mitochondrial-like [Selaginella moellendorffii]
MLGFRAKKLVASVVSKRYYSYPPPPRKKRNPPPAFFDARAVAQIDSCPVTSAARIRATLLLTYHWIWSFQQHRDKKHHCLGGLLRNPDLWICAYQRACYNNKLWSPVSSLPPKTLETLELLMEAVCANCYGWGGTKVVYVCPPHKTAIEATEVDEKSFQDEIVQEVLLMVLEPIYEAKFSRRSFGYRPGRGARECLRFIHGNFGDVSWTVKGDLSKLFDYPQAELFNRVLRNVIQDDKVGELIIKGMKTRAPPAVLPFKRLKPTKRKFLEFEPRRTPLWLEVVLGFAPAEAQRTPDWGCCNKLGPFLANVYLSELDAWMEKQAELFRRPHDPSIGVSFSTDEQEKPNNARKMEYVRFGAHFLISVRGTRDDVLSFEEKCRVFCKQKYHREPEFGAPEAISTPTLFLGHHFFQTKKLKTKWEPSSNKRGTVSKVEKTVFCVDGAVGHAVHSLKRVGVLDDKDNTLPCMRLFHEDQVHNNAHVNKILRALADLYQHSTNRAEMCELIGYLFRSSLAKMYAAKYKLRTQIRVAKSASLDLCKPLKDPQKAGGGAQTEAVPEPLELVYSVPEALVAPIAHDWKPLHEKTLRSVARLLRPEGLQDGLVVLAKELGTCWKLVDD